MAGVTHGDHRGPIEAEYEPQDRVLARNLAAFSEALARPRDGFDDLRVPVEATGGAMQSYRDALALARWRRWAPVLLAARCWR